MKVKKLIFVIFISLILIQFFFIGYAKVNGNSMKPNLYNNQMLIFVKNINNYKRFDIVIVEIESKFYTKRIIGLPGETIEYKDNKLYVNDIEVPEDFDKSITDNFSFNDIYSNNKIPGNQFLLLGDNREYSYDSRNFGLIDISNIKGRMLFKLF